MIPSYEANFRMFAAENRVRELLNERDELLNVLERIVANPEASIGGDIRAEAVALIRKARGET